MNPSKRLIFLFLDGVGVGEPSARNPFYAAKAEFLPFFTGNPGLPGGTPVKPIDPVLGVEGIPQSATGQTSLFTGENVPEMLNQHKDSYPNRWMRKLLREKNLLTDLKNRGIDAVYINAYPVYSRLFTEGHIRIEPDGELHFSGEFPAEFKRRISVTTCMLIAAQQQPFNEKDILEEKALFQDFSNRWLIQKGLHLPEFSPEQAAEILYHASRRYDFILYEYFLTDLYAHRGSAEEQMKLINELNRLLGKLVSLMDPREDTLLLTSDHGNLEDSSVRTHTRNPVPLIVWGHEADRLREGIDRITDVTPALVSF